ncbi:probable protein phosphatase 2C 73 [Zingiber officinale]|uniref:PPM-type phosphatase domain-containing protein n=1 Tax=Zingiber officinale TaxID=94328 RepID=A0A8J5LU62_ZINOF|nr:probable protein phosphatase 2C 73 [Zingiber officinale]KAG6539204.1 hypothetical protein ZIOFF_004357 [Zingiber officinale]
MGACCSRNDDVLELATRRAFMEEEEQEEGEDAGSCLFGTEEQGDGEEGGGDSARVRLRGSSMAVAMYSQQGWKGVNQDSMTVWEGFAGDKDTIFSGTFDGHGPYGHKVSRHVRDTLPSKLQSQLKRLMNDDSNLDTETWFPKWKAIFVNAFEEVDKELHAHPMIDCICSGSTAVTIIKQREHLVIANLGDSRAVICTRDNKNHIVPVQLTVDQKPNIPSEAERIRHCRGRIFALQEEPDVHRLWLPDEDCPGLAMARAFGDFCLKDFGLISTPQISYRKLTDNDEFVVLASDGVWDVLPNKEVIKIVSSASKRSDAPKLVIEKAVRAWRIKHPTSKVDDCTVVCVFLKVPPPTSASNKSTRRSRSLSTASSDISCTSFRTARSSEVSEVELEAGSEEYWNALEGVSRSNSMLKLPRFTKALSWHRKSFKVEEDTCAH